MVGSNKSNLISVRWLLLRINKVVGEIDVADYVQWRVAQLNNERL